MQCNKVRHIVICDTVLLTAFEIKTRKLEQEGLLVDFASVIVDLVNNDILSKISMRYYSTLLSTIAYCRYDFVMLSHLSPYYSVNPAKYFCSYSLLPLT